MQPDRRLARTALMMAACAVLYACTSGPLRRDSAGADATPPIDRATTSAMALAGYLETLQRLMLSPPAEQAEMMAQTQREFDLAPTPSHQLRLALALAVPGHTGTDLARAQRLLRELLAAPETLLPVERALAFLELQKVDSQLTLTAENRRLQSDASRADRERLAAVNKRLQAQLDENARLRKELSEARAKLDAIANIEKSLSERKPNTEGRTQ